MAISYSKDVPSFGPHLPKQPLFQRSKEFRDFLLTKIVNGDNAGLRCEKFMQIRMRTRNGTLADLVDTYSSKLTLEQCAPGGNSGGATGMAHKLAMFSRRQRGLGRTGGRQRDRRPGVGE